MRIITFYIVDRKKELVIRGGYSVYPREIERSTLSDPSKKAINYKEGSPRRRKIPPLPCYFVFKEHFETIWETIEKYFHPICI